MRRTLSSFTEKDFQLLNELRTAKASRMLKLFDRCSDLTQMETSLVKQKKVLKKLKRGLKRYIYADKISKGTSWKIVYLVKKNLIVDDNNTNYRSRLFFTFY